MQTKKEIEEYIERKFGDSIGPLLLFGLSDSDEFSTAFLGLSNDYRAIYSYEGMIDWNYNNLDWPGLSESCNHDEPYTDDEKYETSVEDVEFNALHALYYEPSNMRPIVVREFEDPDDLLACYEDKDLVGLDPNDNTKYSKALIGISDTDDRLVYDYDLLIETIGIAATNDVLESMNETSESPYILRRYNSKYN